MSLKHVNDSYQSLGNTVVNVPYVLDEQVARFKLESLGTSVDALSDEQKAYLDSWDEH